MSDKLGLTQLPLDGMKPYPWRSVTLEVLWELEHIMMHTLDAEDDVWTEDDEGNVILLKDRIEELALRFQYLESASLEPRSGKQPAVRTQE